MASSMCVQHTFRPQCRVTSNTIKTGRVSHLTKIAGKASRRSSVGQQAPRAAKLVCEARKREVEVQSPESPWTQWALDEADKQSMLLLSAVAYVWLTNADPACADSLPMDHSQVPTINEMWTVAEGEDFWVNMTRYMKYGVTVVFGTGYVIIKPLFGLLRKPQTAIPLIIFVVAFVAGIRALLQTMLGLNDPDTVTYVE
eukprot:CAMPEP_0118925172 /NCGR_PEP_ID=MMETSP1169-20130426/3095_1 /TAXON_ID=36882 /ORGANISM="Pyramimonas obovata, Strain CCMP722" /LENGTH=198 /DNA_ID=CAMNT_0006866395 /DNA_START=60 /DNA_END=656 /DNA_ORIENTATION=-